MNLQRASPRGPQYPIACTEKRNDETGRNGDGRNGDGLSSHTRCFRRWDTPERLFWQNPDSLGSTRPARPINGAQGNRLSSEQQDSGRWADVIQTLNTHSPPGSSRSRTNERSANGVPRRALRDLRHTSKIIGINVSLVGTFWGVPVECGYSGCWDERAHTARHEKLRMISNGTGRRSRGDSGYLEAVRLFGWQRRLRIEQCAAPLARARKGAFSFLLESLHAGAIEEVLLCVWPVLMSTRKC
jgi:hypothetical protein